MAAGLDGCTWELLQALPDEAKDRVYLVLRNLMLRGYDPATRRWRLGDWIKRAWTSPIPKSKFDGSTDRLRGISVTPAVARLLGKIITARLTGYVEQVGCLSPAQHGFRRGRSTLHPVALLQNWISQAARQRADTSGLHLLAADVRRAFDLCEPRLATRYLHRIGVPQQLCDFLIAQLDGSETQVLSAFGLSPPIPVGRGTRQGGVESPLLFLLLVDPILHILQKELQAVFENCSLDVGTAIEDGSKLELSGLGRLQLRGGQVTLTVSSGKQHLVGRAGWDPYDAAAEGGAGVLTLWGDAGEESFAAVLPREGAGAALAELRGLLAAGGVDHSIDDQVMIRQHDESVGYGYLAGYADDLLLGHVDPRWLRRQVALLREYYSFIQGMLGGWIFYYGGIASIGKATLDKLDVLSRQLVRRCANLRPDHHCHRLYRPEWPDGLIPASVLLAAAIVHATHRLIVRDWFSIPEGAAEESMGRYEVCLNDPSWPRSEVNCGAVMPLIEHASPAGGFLWGLHELGLMMEQPSGPNADPDYEEGCAAGKIPVSYWGAAHRDLFARRGEALAEGLHQAHVRMRCLPYYQSRLIPRHNGGGLTRAPARLPSSCDDLHEFFSELVPLAGQPPDDIWANRDGFVKFSQHQEAAGLAVRPRQVAEASPCQVTASVDQWRHPDVCLISQLRDIARARKVAEGLPAVAAADLGKPVRCDRCETWAAQADIRAHGRSHAALRRGRGRGLARKLDNESGDPPAKRARPALPYLYVHAKNFRGPAGSGGLLMGEQLREEAGKIGIALESETADEQRKAMLASLVQRPDWPVYFNACWTKTADLAPAGEGGGDPLGARVDRHLLRSPPVGGEPATGYAVSFPPALLVRELVSIGAGIQSSPVCPFPDAVWPLSRWRVGLAEWAEPFALRFLWTGDSPSVPSSEFSFGRARPHRRVSYWELVISSSPHLANLVLTLLALLLPPVREGEVPLVYDAASPMALVLQAARCLPHGTFEALYGQYGPWLALIQSVLRTARLVVGIKASSHTCGFANGWADSVVPLGGTAEQLPANCNWMPARTWPIVLHGLHSRCPNPSPKYTIRNWEAALNRRSRLQWRPRDGSVERWLLCNAAGRNWCGEVTVALNLSHHPRSMEELQQGDLPSIWQELIPDLLRDKRARYRLERGLTLCFKRHLERRADDQHEQEWVRATERWQRDDAIWDLTLREAPEGTRLPSFRVADRNLWTFRGPLGGGPLHAVASRGSERRTGALVDPGGTVVYRGVPGCGPTHSSPMVKLEDVGWVPVAGHPGLIRGNDDYPDKGEADEETAQARRWVCSSPSPSDWRALANQDGSIRWVAWDVPSAPVRCFLRGDRPGEFPFRDLRRRGRVSLDAAVACLGTPVEDLLCRERTSVLGSPDASGALRVCSAPDLFAALWHAMSEQGAAIPICPTSGSLMRLVLPGGRPLWTLAGDRTLEDAVPESPAPAEWLASVLEYVEREVVLRLWHPTDFPYCYKDSHG
eukprot:gene1523-675_t